MRTGRLEKGGALCSEVGVIVENQIGEDGGPILFWDNGSISVEDDSRQAVAAKLTIQWQPMSAARAGVPTQIDYDADGDLFDWQDSLYCLSFAETTEPDPTTGAPVPEYTVIFPTIDDPESEVPGETIEAPWCTVSRTDKITPNGKVLVTEVKVGKGDPYGRFR